MVGNASAYWARRKSGESRQLTEADRLDVFMASKRLGSVRAAARDRKVSWRAANRAVALVQATGSPVSPNRHNSGRPITATTPTIVAKVRAEMTAPGADEYVPTAAAVKRKLHLAASVRSVRRAANKAGLRSRTKKRRPLVGEKSRKARVAWAKAHAKHNFCRTVNSDEKLFVLEDRQKRCWMLDAAPRFRNCLQHPKSLMVWGAISLLGSTKLAFVEGTVDAAAYQKTLGRYLLPLASSIGGPWWFQQDGARCHTAHSTTAWLAAKGINTIPWPAHSPDLSPIENLWGMMVEDVNKGNPSTLDELKSAIRASWKARTSDAAGMHRLLDGWGRRLPACVAAKGATIRH